MKTNHTPQDYTRWNLPEGAKTRIGEGYITGKIVYSPDGTRLVVPKSTGIWVYDASKLEVIDMIGYKQGYTQIEVDNAVGFSADGNLFAITVKGGIGEFREFQPISNHYTFQIWTRETEQPKSISIECPSSLGKMVFSPDGNILAGSEGGVIYLWDVQTGKLRNTITVQRKIDSILFSPDGAALACKSLEGPDQFGDIPSFIDVWDTRTGRHKFGPYSCDFLFEFSPDGQMLAGRAWIFNRNIVSLWDANTGSCKFTSTDCDDPPLPYTYNDTPPLALASSLAFSPDGCTLASFRHDTIHLWDYHTHNCKSTFTDIGYITSLVFSPDGCTLAGGCEDGTVLLWDIDSSINETVLTDDNPFILTEENSEFQNRASQIQQFCEDRGITTLCHFTRVENLQSILQDGLIGRSLLEARGQQFLFNDPDRADGHKEAVCLSISFPNDLLFSKFRYKYSSGNRSEWVVLLLDAKVLWELDCAFCQENAASNTVRHLSWEEKKKPDVLKSMFRGEHRDTKGKVYQRHSSQIPQHYPTHPQAEVLVRYRIGPEYIKEVHFYDETALEQWRYSSLGNYPPKLSVNHRYF